MESPENPTDHPYIKLVASFNMTECYKHMLIAGDQQMEHYISRTHLGEYFSLRKDFVEKYPEVVQYYQENEPSDCTII